MTTTIHNIYWNSVLERRVDWLQDSLVKDHHPDWLSIKELRHLIHVGWVPGLLPIINSNVRFRTMVLCSYASWVTGIIIMRCAFLSMGTVINNGILHISS